MRVLMLAWEYPPHKIGGLGKHVTELVPALAAEGVEIFLVTPRIKGGEPYSEEPVEGEGSIKVYRVDPAEVDSNDFFSLAWRTNLKLQEKAIEVMEQNGPFHLIHVHDWLVAFAGVQIKQQFRLPMVATIHATERGRGRGHLPGELPRAINNVEWWLTYEAWRVICCSQYMSSEVREYFETPLDKIDIIPNGVNTSRFEALDNLQLAEFRSRYAAPGEKIIFYVGRVVEEKGVRVLVESAPSVIESWPACKFVVAGMGPQLQEFRQLAKDKGLAERFYFTGFITDEERDKLYKVADVAVFPSLYEPFGIVALEGMAAKVPVVVADTGGLTEVVTNHQTGIMVYPNNPQSLTWGILHTLQNEGWAKSRAENAYQTVKDVFNWRRVALDTIAVYRQVYNEYLASDWNKKRPSRFKLPVNSLAK
ncbi:MAG: glycosyl transferase group 1 [Chloroflexi bacterium]|jgi:glycogen(starch) synthase|nr:glycosyl transferase group 1 [Chloroflexota bacterium]